MPRSVTRASANAVRHKGKVRALFSTPAQCCSYKVKALVCVARRRRLNILGSLTGCLWTDCVFVVFVSYM